MTPALVLVAIALVGGSGFPGLLSGRASTVGERIALVLVVVGSALGLVVAFGAMGRPASLVHAWSVPGGEIAIRVDALAALFLVPLFVVAPLGSVYALQYWPQRRHQDNGRKLRLFYGLLAAAIALVLVAANAVLFLVGWETMALAAFFAMTTEDQHPAVRQSGYVYLIATRLGTLLLLAMFATLHAVTGSWDFARSHSPIAPAAATAIFVLALFGFGIKAGLMPLHVWLPGAHGNAPSHVSALMSGVMIKTGIYGIARVCSLFDHPPLEWGGTLLAVGTVSGVLGVAFAIGQHDLKRLLAYHSVENIGIITMGLGVAMLGRSVGSPPLVALGLAGALLHVWNHALFKSLLFLSAGAVIHATDTREIDQLGGLARRTPLTAFAFLFGAVAICGLPPLNGFVSELLVYLGLLRATESDRLWMMGAIGAPALALIGGLAGACFAKAYGAVFLGQARSPRVGGAHDPGPAMLVPMACLGLGCLVIGLAPAFVGPTLGGATAAWAPEAAGTSIGDLAPLQVLGVTGPALLALVAAGAVVLGRSTRRARSAAAPTWDCGYAAPSSRMQYTASSFAQLLVGLFSWALRPDVHAAAPVGLFPVAAKFHSHVPDTVLDRAVMPLSRVSARGLRWFRWVQHGNVHLYLVYILAAVLLLLLVSR